jgi:hypothetical protein
VAPAVPTLSRKNKNCAARMGHKSNEAPVKWRHPGSDLAIHERNRGTGAKREQRWYVIGLLRSHLIYKDRCVRGLIAGNRVLRAKGALRMTNL